MQERPYLTSVHADELSDPDESPAFGFDPLPFATAVLICAAVLVSLVLWTVALVELFSAITGKSLG